MTDKINNFTDSEIAVNQLQGTITFGYNENCTLTVRRNNRNASWWNQDLAVKRSKVRMLFSVA
jgi:hypothetical protein